MNELNPENAAFVNEEVSLGHFASASAAMNAGVDLLRRQAALRQKLQHSLAQLESGEYTEYDDEGLDRYFAELFSLEAEPPQP
jgi:Arc/MetJ-type ribon-helix-helix transcriptional regulator